MPPKRKAKAAPRKPAFRRLENDERRAQLLGLGKAAFAKYPYDVVSIDTLAARAKLSKGLFYYYFPTKRDLYIAVVQATAKDMVESLVTSVERFNTPRERAVAGVQAYLDYVESQGQAFLSLMRGGLGADPKIAGAIEQVRADILDKFLRGTPIGTFLQQRPLSRVAIKSWIGMVEAASIEWMASSDLAKDAVRDLLVDLLFDLLSRVLGVQVPQTQYMTAPAVKAAK